MACNSNESDKKLRGSVMEFSQKMESVQEEPIETEVSVSDFESKSLLFLLLLGKRMGIPSGSTERQHRCERSQVPSPSPLVKQPRIFIGLVRGGLGQEPEGEPAPEVSAEHLKWRWWERVSSSRAATKLVG
ncbi:hypothetical protein NL676_023328 [Syzygium grande]|nr:hypothetical protein NL676_023328 [Syzygium grande]